MVRRALSLKRFFGVALYSREITDHRINVCESFCSLLKFSNRMVFKIISTKNISEIAGFVGRWQKIEIRDMGSAWVSTVYTSRAWKLSHESNAVCPIPSADMPSQAAHQVFFNLFLLQACNAGNHLHTAIESPRPSKIDPYPLEHLQQ